MFQVLHFYFNAEQKGNSPTQFKEEVTTIDFPEEVERNKLSRNLFNAYHH